MNNSQTLNYFEPDVYINDLMNDIGFADATEQEKEQMYKGLNEQVTHLVLNSISLYVEPEQIDETIVNHGDLKDLGKFIEKLVEISPEAQMAIIEALDNFYTETIETYEQFKSM